MAEEIKKETRKTTTKKATPKKKVESKEEATATTVQQQMNITPEMMQQMFTMFQTMMQQTQPVQQTQVKEDTKKVANKNKKWTKSMLNDILTEKINVKSVVKNVVYFSKNENIRYAWAEIGDYETLSIKTVLEMARIKRFFHTPWLMIEDDRVIQALGLEELYKNINLIRNTDSLLEMTPEEIKNIMNKVPYEFQRDFANEVYMKIKGREITDIVTISTLDEILPINLKDAL